MAHEFIPGSSDAIVPPTSEANSINLDLSSRNKIVIHPRSKDYKVKQNSISPPLRMQSIFKNAKERHCASLDVDNTVTAPKVEGKFAPIPQQQVPSPVRGNDWEAKKAAKLAQVRQAMGRIEKKPIEKRSPPRAVNLGSVAPVIPMPRSEFQSPYVEEYAKCGCTKHGGNPCRRCQLMLLSDRFCDLVNFQCEKWNVPK